MLSQTKDILRFKWGISDRLIKSAEEAEKSTLEARLRIKEIGAHNQLKVLTAFKRHGVSDYHLKGTTGYGFGDAGRDVLDEIYADVFGAEKALVRMQFVSGTHALASVLFGVLRPGDKWISVIGTPYDTMAPVIQGGNRWRGSLSEWGIEYGEIPLDVNYSFDKGKIKEALKEKIKLVYIQRSLGYTWRPSVNLEMIREIAAYIKSLSPETVIMADNCYGEFADTEEPISVGADVMAGSLIKNAGGGLSPAGGYVAGRKDIVEKASVYLTSPGIGPDEGATLGVLRLMYQGFFMAPSIVSGAIEGAIWASAMLKSFGFEVLPEPDGVRTDIIQGIKFSDPEIMKSFCKGIQNASPIDASAVPEAVDMPGYRDPIIMAGGTFVQGSSIELSCDGPLRSPYAAYLQGGLSFAHIQFGVLNALKEVGF